MGQDADELRRDIERTRDDLGGTLDAIGDRVSPGRMIERRTNRMRNTVRSMRERVMGGVGDTTAGAVDGIKHAPETALQRTEGAPMVAGALAFGVGFLTAAVFPPTEREKQMAPTLMEKVEPVKQELAEAGSEVAEHLREPAKQAASEMTERVKEGAEHVRAGASNPTSRPGEGLA